MDEVNPLRTVRSLFYLGLYDNVSKEAEAAKRGSDLSPEKAVEADCFLFRALEAVNPKEALKKISDKHPQALQFIKLLAMLHDSPTDDTKETVVSTLEEWISASNSMDVQSAVLASQLYFEVRNYKDAFKVLMPLENSIEKMAMAVKIYLKIDRLDLALKQFKSMQDIDDDDALCTLCNVWVSISQGEEKATEATFQLQELIDKFGPSITVYNSLGVCQMQAKNFSKALDYLKQARDLALQTKVPVSGDTLVNTMVCLVQLRKPQEIISKIMSELRDVDPHNAWLKRQTEAEALFDKHAANYKYSL